MVILVKFVYFCHQVSILAPVVVVMKYFFLFFLYARQCDAWLIYTFTVCVHTVKS